MRLRSSISERSVFATGLLTLGCVRHRVKGRRDREPPQGNEFSERREKGTLCCIEPSALYDRLSHIRQSAPDIVMLAALLQEMPNQL